MQGPRRSDRLGDESTHLRCPIARVLRFGVKLYSHYLGLGGQVKMSPPPPPPPPPPSCTLIPSPLDSFFTRPNSLPVSRIQDGGLACKVFNAQRPKYACTVDWEWTKFGRESLCLQLCLGLFKPISSFEIKMLRV